MTIEELKDILDIDKSYRIERTVSTGNMDKFQEPICAIANDFPDKKQKGCVFIMLVLIVNSIDHSNDFTSSDVKNILHYFSSYLEYSQVSPYIVRHWLLPTTMEEDTITIHFPA